MGAPPYPTPFFHFRGWRFIWYNFTGMLTMIVSVQERTVIQGSWYCSESRNVLTQKERSVAYYSLENQGGRAPHKKPLKNHVCPCKVRKYFPVSPLNWEALWGFEMKELVLPCGGGVSQETRCLLWTGRIPQVVPHPGSSALPNDPTCPQVLETWRSGLKVTDISERWVLPGAFPLWF